MTERQLSEPPDQSYVCLSRVLYQYGKAGKLDRKNPDGSFQFTLQSKNLALHFQAFYPEESLVEYWEVDRNGPRKLTITKQHQLGESGSSKETRETYPIRKLGKERAQELTFLFEGRVQVIKRIIGLNSPTPR